MTSENSMPMYPKNHFAMWFFSGRERRKIQQTMGNPEMVAYLVRKQRAQADQQAFEPWHQQGIGFFLRRNPKFRPGKMGDALDTPILVEIIWEISNSDYNSF